MMRRAFGGASSEMKIAVRSPNGTPMIVVTTVTQNVAISGGRMPNLKASGSVVLVVIAFWAVRNLSIG